MVMAIPMLMDTLMVMDTTLSAKGLLMLNLKLNLKQHLKLMPNPDTVTTVMVLDTTDTDIP